MEKRRWLMMKNDNKKPVKINYKIRMVVEVEGSIEDTRTLREDTGIEPFVQWACEDIEEKLNCVCDVVGVKKVELEEVE